MFIVSYAGMVLNIHEREGEKRTVSEPPQGPEYLSSAAGFTNVDEVVDLRRDR